MSDLEQRLRRKVQVFPMTGGGSLNGRCYITDDGKRLANPDGPEAADRLRQYREACELVRETMGTQSNGGTGWMAQFEALAFPPALKETTDVD